MIIKERNRFPRREILPAFLKRPALIGRLAIGIFFSLVFCMTILASILYGMKLHRDGTARDWWGRAEGQFGDQPGYSSERPGRRFQLTVFARIRVWA